MSDRYDEEKPILWFISKSLFSLYSLFSCYSYRNSGEIDSSTSTFSTLGRLQLIQLIQLFTTPFYVAVFTLVVNVFNKDDAEDGGLSFFILQKHRAQINYLDTRLSPSLCSDRKEKLVSYTSHSKAFKM